MIDVVGLSSEIDHVWIALVTGFMYMVYGWRERGREGGRERRGEGERGRERERERETGERRERDGRERERETR